MTDRRVLPHNVEAEASILGGIILRNEVLADVPELETEAFYDNRHKVVFQAIRELAEAERPIDVVTLENEIARRGKLDAIGGIAFLGELTCRVPTADNVIAYSEIVADKHRARMLMLESAEIVERGYEPDLDVPDYLATSEARILAATVRRSRGDDTQGIGAIARARIAELDGIIAARARGERALTGAPTGIHALDELLGGWPFGVVSILAGRPAMGKSSTSLASAEASAEAGYGAHVFSLEDPRAAYADRALARRTGIATERFRQGDLGRQEAGAMAQAASDLRKLSDRWIFDDRGGLTAREIVRSARRHRAKNRTRLVIVDHLQLVGRTDGLHENAALEEIVNTFAAAARDPGEGGELWAWLILCQLNRKVEEREDKRPHLADLRGSGAIEQSARAVVMQYRGAYYGAEPKIEVDYDCSCVAGVPKSACPHRPDDDAFQRSVQLIIAKNNNGRTGRAFATWNGPTTEIR